MITGGKKKNTASQTFYRECREEEKLTHYGSFGESEEKPGLLLHSCCGPCSTAVVERLVEEYNVTVFFYNPCITDENEYQKRKAAQLRFIEQYNMENMGKTVVHFKEGRVPGRRNSSGLQKAWRKNLREEPGAEYASDRGSKKLPKKRSFRDTIISGRLLP